MPGINVWPVDAVSGSPVFSARRGRQLSVAPFLAGATAARPLGARSGVRPGTSATTVTATSTTWTVNEHVGVIDAEAAAEAGPYTYSVDSVQTGPVNAAGAFARIDLISVQISDPAESDGTPSTTPASAVIIYTASTAAAPAVPATPARSMTIAQINVPASGGGAPSVTWVAPTLAAAGGITPATTAAFGSGAYVGQYIDDPVRGLLRWDGTNWTIAAGKVGYVYDATYGWMPQTVGGDVVITLTAGTGANTLPFGKTYAGVEKYVWTVWNADGLSQNNLYVTSTHPIGTGSKTSIDFRYSGAAAGSARLAWAGVYRA